MHTYMQTEKDPGLWTVFFIDTKTRTALKDFGSEASAAAYVSFLNGGEHPAKPWPPEIT
jgi:hypothetical protein